MTPVASREHYWDHMEPVVAELSNREGIVVQDRVTSAWGVRSGILLASSMADLNRASRAYVLMEHGAGQTYNVASGWAHSSYAGSQAASGCVGFLTPNKKVADTWKAVFPLKPGHPVGCPKLDRYLKMDRPDRATVAITHHWDCFVAPESRSAFQWYKSSWRRVIESWRAEGWEVWGHAHPKIAEELLTFWRSIGVVTASADQVLTWAGVLVADNTSLLTEMVALDRGVVFLNAPWYRPEAAHGGRFWDWTIAGPMVDVPEDLLEPGLLDAAIDDFRLERREVAEDVYAFIDGSSSRRAADAIVEILKGL